MIKCESLLNGSLITGTFMIHSKSKGKKLTTLKAWIYPTKCHDTLNHSLEIYINKPSILFTMENLGIHVV